MDQNLLMRAVRKHAKDRWIVLYIERWLKAPVQEEDGRLVPREKGTPQGGVISPLLANLFLHYGLDRWLQANYPKVVFERFADDAIVHCRTEGEALAMRKAIAERLQNCGLELHPEKTKIVYCKDDDRRRTYLNEKFDFLGYTFRPRRSKNRKGKHFINFSPAVSNQSAQAMRDAIRSWNLPKRSDKAIDDLSHMFHPIIRVGSVTTDDTIARRSIRPCANSTVTWLFGPSGNTKGCAIICEERHTGSRASHAALRRCSPTGRWVCGVALWWEPYES
jgi:RNA-directed DNA polymerase